MKALLLPPQLLFSPQKKFRQSGQTTIEYLMLLAMAFAITWLVTNNLLEGFITDNLTQVNNGIRNTVRNAEWRPTEVNPGAAEHPGNPNRHRAMHF